MLGGGRSFLEGKFSRVLSEPPSVGVATSVIVSATAVVVVGSGVLIWALDHSEYPNIWVGMWWALQTVTTVGYGDVSPANPSGRIIASFVMFYGVAFVTVFIAAITSIFVARASEDRGMAGPGRAAHRGAARRHGRALGSARGLASQTNGGMSGPEERLLSLPSPAPAPQRRRPGSCDAAPVSRSRATL